MKHKLATIGFTYLAGLLCASFLGSLASFIAAGIFLLATLPFALTKKTTLAVFAFTFGAALAVYSINTVLLYDKVVAKVGETHEINGVVTDINEIGNDLCVYEVEAQIDGVKTKLSFFAADNGASINDAVSFTAELCALSDNSNFAEKSYYKTKGVFISAKLKSAVVSESKGNFSFKTLVYDFSDYIGEKISLLLPNEEGDLLRAFFLGDKSGLSDELADNIKYSGISHFAAVSGLHLTLISHIFMLIISLTPLKNHKKTKFFLLAGLILLFMLFFRLSMSVVRAGLMLIIFYGAEPLRRKNSTFNSMGLAAVIILLFNPYACLDIGFLLSLAGTFGIGVLAPKINSHLRQTRFVKAKNFIISSLCPTICTFPLAAAYFGGFSTVGLLMNLLLYPFFIVAMVCVVGFVLLGGHGNGAMFIAGLCAKPMVWLINFFGSLKFSYIPLEFDFLVPILILSCIFAVAVYLVFKSAARTVMSVGISVAVICAFVTAQRLTSSELTAIRVFSDGENACVFFSNNSGSVVIAASDSPDIRTEIKRFIRLNFIDELSVLCVLRSEYNNVPAFEALKSEYFSFEAQDKTLRIDGCADIEISGDNCILTSNDFKLVISRVSEPLESDIMLLYGLKRSSPSFENAALVLYANKNIDCDEANEKSLYYTEISYYLDGNLLIEN